MRYNAAPERRAEIERILRTSGYASSAEMSQRIGVSEMTIRRDLQRLESKGMLRRVAGGAMLRARTAAPFERRAEAGAAQKQAIARAAADLIDSASMVALDAGTTVAAMAPMLTRPVVVTHSLPVIATLATRSPERLISMGGHYQADTRSFAGPIAAATLREIYCDFAVISGSAVTAKAPWCSNVLDAAIKRVLISHSQTVVFLADSRKIARTAPLKIADWKAIDVLITDRAADAETCDAIRAHGVDVRVVTAPTPA